MRKQPTKEIRSGRYKRVTYDRNCRFTKRLTHKHERKVAKEELFLEVQVTSYGEPLTTPHKPRGEE